MGFEAVISALGLQRLLTGNAFLAEIGLLGASAILFVISMVVCGMAFRAAGAARRARAEALDLAVEVRHLTAQVEKATARRSGAQPVVEEAGGEFSGEDAETPAGAADDVEPADRTLEEAKNAATVPSALLRSFVRRRS